MGGSARGTLRRGARGPAVTELQRLLNAAGTQPGLDEDGAYGPLTRRAVVALQQTNGLSVDGVAGPRTWQALDEGGAIESTPSVDSGAGQTASVDQAAATEEQSQGQATVEREPGGEAAASQAEANSPDAELARRIRSKMRSGGLSVAIYGSGIGAESEFKRQSDQWAADNGAIGMHRGRLVEGKAMTVTESASDLLAALALAVGELLARFPESGGPGDVSGISITRLGLFTHGLRNKLQIAPGGSWVSTDVRRLEPWVESIVPYLGSSPQISLYACSTAGRPSKGVPFAEALQATLKAELDERYGEGAEVNPVVWGHLDPGHTTANSRLVRFDGSEHSEGGDNLYRTYSEKFERLALDRAHSAGEVDPDTMDRLDDPGKRAMRRVFHARGSTGRTNPINVLIREIPAIGLERLWEDLSGDRTPDYDYLGMEPEATDRVEQGIETMRQRFQQQLQRLAGRLAPAD